MPPFAHSNVYVKGLPDGISEQEFTEMFETYGNIVSCKFMSDKHIGFVKFAEVHEAQAAIDKMNGIEYNGAQLIVRFANNDRGDEEYRPGPPWAGNPYGPWAGYGGHPSHFGANGGAPGPSRGGPPQIGGDGMWSDNLYIKGLPPNMTEMFLHEVFGAYGTVVSVKVLETNGRSADGHSESVAMVRMAHSDQAGWIVENLNGKAPEGLDRPVTVRFADPPGRKPYPYKPVWQQQAPWQQQPMAAPAMPGPCKGSGAGPWPQRSEPSAESSDKCNIYIKDLPLYADDLYLYRVFAPFGAVLSVKAMLNADGSCMGFGFVKYALEEDAQKAITEANGQPLQDGNVLKVSLKTDKKPRWTG